MKKKILFVLHIPPPVNGAAMVGSFIKNNEKINTIFDTSYVNLTTSFSLDAIGKGKGSKLVTILKIQWNVLKNLLKKSPDVCYLTLTAKGPGFYKDFLIVLLLKIFNKKIVYHFHNKGVEVNSHTSIHRFLYRFTFKNTKSILLSPNLYQDIKRYVKKEDVYFCPNGIPNIVMPEPSEKNMNEAPVCKFLFLSNMMEEKGVLVLLEACEILKNKNINFECHFIGAWSDITEAFFYKTLEEFDIQSEVFAHGKQYGDDKLKFFQSADVFVFPTFYHNECFPLVLLEAMQAELPIVSTNEGGIEDIVQDGITGVLVERRNSEVLAEKLELLINDKLWREKMGKAGKDRFDQFFTIDHFENKILEILKQVEK